MPAWFPLIKVVLPYIGPIMQATIPAFTKKKSVQTDQVVAQQITELQDAVNRNSEATRALAHALEEAARANDHALRQTRRLALVALVIGLVSLAVTVSVLI